MNNMQIAIRQCLKDITCRWPYIVALESVIVIRAVLDILLPLHPDWLTVHRLSGGLITILAGLTTALAVHTDPLMDDRMFWITRPMTWRDVLAGKFLFLICTIQLPILITQLIALAVNNISVLSHISVLGQTQLFISSILLLFMAIASATRNLAQYIIFALGALAANAVFVALTIAGSHLDMDWGSAETIRFWIFFTLWIPIALLLLWLQYSRRMPKRALTLAFIAILSVHAFSYCLSLWHPLALLRAKTEGVWRSSSPITLAFIQDQPPSYVSGWKPGKSNVAALLLPVRVTGIPEGRKLLNERMNFKVLAQDGYTWETGWTGFGGICRNGADISSRFPVSDGDYLIAADMDGRIYDRIQNEHVRVQASFAFRLGRFIQIPISGNMRIQVDDQIIICRTIPEKNAKQVLCLFSKAPNRIPDYHTLGLSNLNIDPSGSIWRYSLVSSNDVLGRYHEESWFEATMEIPQIRLKDFMYRRFTTP